MSGPNPTAADSEDTRPTKTWRKWVTTTAWLLGVACALISIEMSLHVYFLSQVPAVPLPFDQELVGTVTVAPENNALELYQEASRLTYRESGKEWSEQYERAMDAERSEDITPRIQTFLTRNRPAFEKYVEGSKRPDFLHTQPRELTLNSSLDLSGVLREITRSVCVEAKRREFAGDLTGAWQLLSAALRVSRHVAQHGCLIDRMIAAAMHAIAAESVVTLSRNPQVDAAFLRRAIADVEDIYRRTPPPSRTLQVDYFILSNLLDHPEDYFTDDDAVLRSVRPSFFLHAIGEREISRRVIRLTYTNWMSQMDLPRRNRTAATGPLGLFSPAPTVVSAQHTPQQIQDALERTFYAKAWMTAGGMLILTSDREQVRQSLLELHLAVQLFAREHQNQLPEKLEQLVPAYRKSLPEDLWGPPGLVKYRRENGTLRATLWSVGPDGVDDFGKLAPGINANGNFDDIVLPTLPIKDR